VIGTVPLVVHDIVEGAPGFYRGLGCAAFPMDALVQMLSLATAREALNPVEGNGRSYSAAVSARNSGETAM